MKIWKQLLRQPGKTAAGLTLVTLAVMILTVSVGQVVSTAVTRADLDDRYTTIALKTNSMNQVPTENGMLYTSHFTDEVLEWIDRTIAERTDIIQGESYTGLVSGYIPGMNIDNFSRHPEGNNMGDQQYGLNVGNPYRCAVLEVILEQIAPEVMEHKIETGSPGQAPVELTVRTSCFCLGTVVRAIGLEEGFRSPEGNRILLKITAANAEALEALTLEPGGRYLVFGMDYNDLKGYQMNSYLLSHPQSHILFQGRTVPEIEQELDCTLSVVDVSELPILYHGENGMEIREDYRQYNYFSDMSLYMTYLPAEEYIAAYDVPTLTALNGTAEELIASEEGALWRKALEIIDVSSHAFPILAVEKLAYQPSVVRGQCRIVEGRDFTEAERTEGQKVCILAESLARQNGLNVGDTIQMRTYLTDPNFEAVHDDVHYRNAYPSAGIYVPSQGFTSDMESYTIVGLYRCQDEWLPSVTASAGGVYLANPADPYGFTPNTIFVPKASVSGGMILNNKGIYHSLVLRNGKMQAFQDLLAENGYAHLFNCYDQGYSDVQAALADYEAVAAKVFRVGLAAFLVLTALYLLLFPLQQKKTLATMTSLGAPRHKKLGYLAASSLWILGPGALLGALAGLLLWDRITASMMDSIQVRVPLDANILAILPAMALIQLAAVMGVVLVLGLLLSGRKNARKAA